MAVRAYSDGSVPSVVYLGHTTVAGGAELALVRMLRADAPLRATVLHPPGSTGEGVYAQLPAAVEVHRVGVRQPHGASAVSRLRAIPVAARLLVQAIATRLHPSFLHADLIVAASTRAAVYGALACATSRTPFVVYLHDIMDEATLGGLGVRMMRRLVLPRADGVIANSKATLASAVPYLRAEAVRDVLPGASGLTRRPRSAREGGPLRIGMLARIDPWKGQMQLLDAFARAFPHGDAILEFAGAAPFGHADYADALRDRAEALGIADRVRLLGHVEDVDALLRTWDVGVQASTRAEPLGLNVLEYLDAGLATVVADEGGPIEWVRDGENGIAVPARDVAALAAALRRLGDDAVLRERLGAAAAHTPGLATDHEIAELHARAYQRLLAPRRRRAVRTVPLSPAAIHRLP